MKRSAMGLFGKIFLLVIAEIVLIVACVYIHIGDMTFNQEVKQQINVPAVEPKKEEPKIEEPLKKMVQPDNKPIIPEKIKEAIKPTIKKEEPKIKEAVKVAKKVEKKAEKTVREEVQKSTPTITDEKVKNLFDKKKEESQPIKETTIDETTILELEKRIAKVVKENRIIFKRLSTDVTDKSKETIQKIAQILKEYPTVKVEVGGHTDAKGDDEVNAYISKQRALSVRKLLIKDGVNKDRLTAKGYGESQPIVKNDPQGYSIQNRRVEFKVIKD